MPRNSQQISQSRIPKKKHRTGRYIAVGAFLIVTLLTLHHVLLRDASKIAGIFVPTIIMGCYILWIAYSARRDKLKIRRRRAALAMQLTEVISTQPPASKSPSLAGTKGAKGGGGGVARTPQKDTPKLTVLTSVQERPVIVTRIDSDGEQTSGEVDTTTGL